MYNNNQKSKQGFPNPLEPTEVKESKEYGVQYAKAIESQWGKTTDDSSLVGKRNRVFEKDRDYATGVQDTSIYKQLLNSLQPNKGDGSLLNMDYTPVPILPKVLSLSLAKPVRVVSVPEEIACVDCNLNESASVIPPAAAKIGGAPAPAEVNTCPALPVATATGFPEAS